MGQGETDRTEFFLREVNENIEQAAGRLGVSSDSWRFLCECGRPGCRETVELTLAEFDDVTAHGLLLAEGHVRAGSVPALQDQGGERSASSVSNSFL